jgi:hypothetical protein
VYQQVLVSIDQGDPTTFPTTGNGRALESTEHFADLAEIVLQWPHVPVAIRTSILALVRSMPEEHA